MKPNPPFVDHCLELLSPLGPVRARHMFGGWGLYADGLFVALIAADRLYLKVDAGTREHFAGAGCEPFVYRGGGKDMTMNYWTVPAEALESPALMRPWAQLALQAALAAARAPKKAPRKVPKKAPKEVRKESDAAVAVRATGTRRRRLG